MSKMARFHSFLLLIFHCIYTMEYYIPYNMYIYTTSSLSIHLLIFRFLSYLGFVNDDTVAWGWIYLFKLVFLVFLEIEVEFLDCVVCGSLF